MAIKVNLKHAGKTYADVPLDPTLPGSAFKEAVYNVTGVPPAKQKVMIKGGVLKDDTNWSTIDPKPGQTFMVIGAAGELPKPPEKPVVFLEDLDDTELAEALRMPVGLRNLGNTCYMASTVQYLRAVPELQTALQGFRGSGGDPQSSLTASMRDLYDGMNKTTEGYMPVRFIQTLRQVAPQFGEQVRGAYAQQDAEECWVQIVNSLAGTLPGVSAENTTSNANRFVDQYLRGEITKELTCDEADEPAVITKERILKLECHIDLNTNYMHSGILNGLNQKIEKTSPSLGREATYSQKSRISRLPSNLTVHMVRFYWRRDINKKAKIMRKVKFPFELDALDLVTDDLKKKIAPVNGKMKEIARERAERRKVRRRTKMKATEAAEVAAVASQTVSSSAVQDVVMAEATSSTTTGVAPGELEDENVLRKREAAELEAVVNPEIRADTGASVSGLYDLCAIVTHKGASADGGHYIAFVKRSALDSKFADEVEDDKEEWIKFDDDKVSIVTREKIAQLDGGGEDSSAYLLLYRSKSLA